MLSPRTTARTVGALMLGAFLLYGVGSSIATTTTSPPLLAIGVAMMLLNSLVVIAIGVFMLPIIKPHAPVVAVGYLVTRIVEGVLLGIGAVNLLAASASSAPTNFVQYNLGMAALGIGSIFFCVVLFRSGLVPRFLAVWGLVGYATFATGSLLELAGVVGAGLPTTVPGGLFELFFSFWLIVKGFGARAALPIANRA